MIRSGPGDQCSVDGADRCADDPVGLKTVFVQRFVDPSFERAERIAAAEDENDVEGTDSLRLIGGMASLAGPPWPAKRDRDAGSKNAEHKKGRMKFLRLQHGARFACVDVLASAQCINARLIEVVVAGRVAGIFRLLLRGRADQFHDPVAQSWCSAREKRG